MGCAASSQQRNDNTDGSSNHRNAGGARSTTPSTPEHDAADPDSRSSRYSSTAGDVSTVPASTMRRLSSGLMNRQNRRNSNGAETALSQSPPTMCPLTQPPSFEVATPEDDTLHPIASTTLAEDTKADCGAAGGVESSTTGGTEAPVAIPAVYTAESITVNNAEGDATGPFSDDEASPKRPSYIQSVQSIPSFRSEFSVENAAQPSPQQTTPQSDSVSGKSPKIYISFGGKSQSSSSLSAGSDSARRPVSNLATSGSGSGSGTNPRFPKPMLDPQHFPSSASTVALNAPISIELDDLSSQSEQVRRLSLRRSSLESGFSNPTPRSALPWESSLAEDHLQASNSRRASNSLAYSPSTNKTDLPSPTLATSAQEFK